MSRKPSSIDYSQAAVEALLARNSGRISPAILVEEARPETSPFHRHFEWDDSDAAELYRLGQAAHIIRTWRGSIMRIDAEHKMIHVTTTRRVQSPESARGKGLSSYETVEQIMSDPAKRADMLHTVLAELSAYRKRYAELEELAMVWVLLDTVIEAHAPPKRKSRDSADRPHI